MTQAIFDNTLYRNNTAHSNSTSSCQAFKPGTVGPYDLHMVGALSNHCQSSSVRWLDVDVCLL